MSPFILHRSIPRAFFLPYCFVPAVFRFCTSLSDKVNVLFVFLASFVISTVWVDETKTIHMTPTNIEKKTQFVPRLPWFRGAAFQGMAIFRIPYLTVGAFTLGGHFSNFWYCLQGPPVATAVYTSKQRLKQTKQTKGKQRTSRTIKNDPTQRRDCGHQIGNGRSLPTSDALSRKTGNGPIPIRIPPGRK